MIMKVHIDFSMPQIIEIIMVEFQNHKHKWHRLMKPFFFWNALYKLNSITSIENIN